MKRITSFLFVCVFSLAAVGSLGVFGGCNKNKSLLNPKKPVTLTMWHVYGEQAESPMKSYVDEFNATVGKEKGAVIDITLTSNASQIGEKLLSAQHGTAGVPSMPDLFFCHASNAMELGANNLLNWNDYFSKDELSGFIDGFLSDGTVNGSLSVLPVSKSTHLLFLAGGAYERFAIEKNVSFDDLSTWDGFFAVSKKFFEYSGGKPFCALDYVIRSTELDAISRGASDFYSDNGWYKDNEILLESFTKFASAIAKGHIVVSDMYSNTQVMDGQTIAGISSSAAALYYNDKITYDDNTWEYTRLKVMPVPQSGVGKRYATQAGVGLSAYKTTEKKAEAAALFAKWFTEEKRNLDFVAQTGYMPVKKGAFNKLASYDFKNDAFKNTYLALDKTMLTCEFISEPSINGFYPNTYKLYKNIRELQKELKGKREKGESVDSLTRQIVDFFLDIGK